MSLEDLATLVRTRRSIRRFRPDEVPDDLLLRAIEMASWAPSGGNFQPWQFVVVKNRRVIEAMADAMDASSRLMASWPEAEPFRKHADRWLQTGAFFRHAPVCIAALSGVYASVADQMMAARGEHDPAANEMMQWRRGASSRVQTVAGAIMILLLALHQQGLGACWMAGPLQTKREIQQILGISPEWEFQALIPVGWAAEEKEGGPRKPLAETVRFIR